MRKSAGSLPTRHDDADASKAYVLVRRVCMYALQELLLICSRVRLIDIGTYVLSTEHVHLWTPRGNTNSRSPGGSFNNNY
jgi:hypothetical protein